MGNFELTPEILNKASECETAEEILTKAKEYGKDITIEQAQRLFDMSHASGAVSDEELDNVAGGAYDKTADCPYCKAMYIEQKALEKHIYDNHPEKFSEYRAKRSSSSC